MFVTKHKEKTLFKNAPERENPDPLLDGIDGDAPRERPLITRGLYADAHAEILVELEAIHRDIQHHHADGNRVAVSRLRVLESHTLDRLARIKLDAIAELCFGVRAAMLVNDHSLPDCLTELLAGRMATKSDLDEIKAGLKIMAELCRRAP